MSPISIVGIGARVPGAVGVDEFWNTVLTGHDRTTADPNARWRTTVSHNPRRGGYIDGIDQFDHEWFGISGREAAAMDPQQRIALLTAVDAVHDAGIENLGRGSNAAVVMGASSFDHGSAMLGRRGRTGPYTVTGSVLSIVANRISYAMDYRAASLVVDSACSSSLAAVDLGCTLLLDPDIPFVVVGGVNAILLPHITDSFAESGFLAPDGRCKTFDEAADGYVRAEGSVVVVLRRKADAEADHNRVYAEIVGSAVNSDGRSNGLYAPNGVAQQRVIDAAWRKSGRFPGEAGYFECHGTGTALGDAVEVSALAAMAPRDGREHAIVLGSLKTVTGHLEAAAGVAGIAKAALIAHRGLFPPTPNFSSAASGLELIERRFEVLTAERQWQADPADRLIGVSSFGFGGTNAHAVVRGVDPVLTVSPNRTPVVVPAAFVVSAQEHGLLQQVAGSWMRWFASRPDVLLADAAFTSRRVATDDAKVAVVTSDLREVVHALATLSAGGRDPALIYSPAGMTAATSEVLFLFPGQGGQYDGMGAALAERYPSFRRAARNASDAVLSAGGPEVWSDSSGLRSGNTGVVQPAMFVYQVAMLALLETYGVRPAAVIGHSLGEVAAAYAAGALSLADAASVVVARSTALSGLDGQGSMAMFEMDASAARRLIDSVSDVVALAAVNGPRSVVLSGVTDVVNSMVDQANSDGVFARIIAVDFPAHSPAVARVAPYIERALQHVSPSAQKVPMYSTTDLTLDPDLVTPDARYWRDNAGRTVELYEAVRAARLDGYSNVVEVCAHPVLARSVLDSTDDGVSVISSAHREDEVQAFVECLARLSVCGVAIEWPYANETYSTPPPRVWRRNSFPLQTLETRSGTRQQIELDLRLLSQHEVVGSAVVPAAQWLVAMSDASQRGTPAISGFEVHDRTYLDGAGATSMDIVLDSESGNGRDFVQVYAAGTGARDGSAVASARMVPTALRPSDEFEEEWPLLQRAVPTQTLYENFDASGVAYGPGFRRLSGVRAGMGRASGHLVTDYVDAVTTVDAALQLIAAAIPSDWAAGRSLLPVKVDYSEFDFDADEAMEVRATATVVDDRTVLGAVAGSNASGRRTLYLRGVEICAVDHAPAVAEGALLVEQWEPFGATGPRSPDHRVYVGTSAVAARLHERDESSSLVREKLGSDPSWTRTAVHAGRSFVLVVSALDAEDDPLVTGVGAALTGLDAVLGVAAATAVTLVVAGEVRTEFVGAVIGAVRCVSLERGIDIRVVHLPELPGIADVDAVIRLVSSTGGPLETRIDSGVLSRRRLVPESPVALNVSDLDGNATYVVTGGGGGLGSMIVQWLLDNGAGAVAILRRSPTEVTPYDGDRVVQITCNATDRVAVSRAMQTVRMSGRRIGGLVHAAGALRDAALSDIDRGLLNAVFLPKVIAAQHLLEETDRDNVDFTILFSSAAGTVGAPGQAGYGAANAALDEVAQRYRRAGRRVTSLAWGVISSVGMAHSAGGAEHLTDGGLIALDEIKVRRLFSQSLTLDKPVLTAVAVVPNTDEGAVAVRVRQLTGNLDDVAHQGERTSLMSSESIGDLVHRTVSEVVGLRVAEVDPNDRFADLGVSSLLAMDIRRRLESALKCRVSTTELFAHPSVTELARSLCERLLVSDEETIAPESSITETDSTVERESDLFARATALLGRPQ